VLGCSTGKSSSDGAKDLFTFQDQIASSISGAVDPRVREAEISRVRERPTDSLDGYARVLQCNPNRQDLDLAGDIVPKGAT